MNVYFEKANLTHKDIIFGWLKEPHVQASWDNTQAHKDDILNFMNNRVEPSSYCDGLYTYWVGFVDSIPYCMIMLLQERKEYDIPAIKKNYLSKYGNTYSMDFMIGNKDYLGKGLGAKTLEAFISFIRNDYDNRADTFLIDPAVDNPKAKHIYMKAGFEYVGDFVMSDDVSGAGKLHHLLIKRFAPDIKLVLATIADYPTIQNMARFYVYDMSRYCGMSYPEWRCPDDGLYECDDFKKYIEDPISEAFLIKVYDELAGFVLIDKFCAIEAVDWNMGQFFILAKFQQTGLGLTVARKIFKKFPGKWSVGAMSENTRAVAFWRKLISEVSRGNYTEQLKTSEELKTKDHPEPYPMIIMIFNTDKHI